MKKSQTYSICYWLAGAACAVSTGQVFAVEASDVLVFSKGPLSLRPQFGLIEQFDDNIFYGDEDRESDFITIISPGLKLQLGQDLPAENHITLAYTYDRSFYVHNSSQNANQHHFITDTFFKKHRLSIEGADRFELLSSVLGGGFSVGRQQVDRTLWWDIYRVDYQVGERMGVYVEGQHVSTDYESGVRLFDTRTLTGTGGFEYTFSEDIFLFGEAYYGQTTLEPNEAATAEPPGTQFIGGFVGVRGKFSEKLNGRLKAGYEISTFQGNIPAGVDDSAGSAPVVEASITYLPTERLTTTLTYSRRQQVSVQFVRSSYVLDTVSANIQQVLGSTGRLRLDLTGTYAMFSFDPAPAYPAGRSDNNWKVQTGASYFFQTWLSTRLEYSFERFTSDFASVVDYDVNRVTLSLAIGY
jgi:hypothetical protein